MFLYSDFTRLLISDIARRVPGFSHLVAEQVGVLAHRRAAHGCTGNYAACHGLRKHLEPTFSVWVRRRSRIIEAVSPWFVEQPLHVDIDGQRAKYLISIRLPRMLDHDPLTTLVHELYHVAVPFDGSLRPARHGRAFDHAVEKLRDRYLSDAVPEVARVARMNLPELTAEFGTVFCLGLPDRFRWVVRRAIAPVESHERGVARLYPRHRLDRDYHIRPLTGGTGMGGGVIREEDCPLFSCTDRGLKPVPRSYLHYARRSCAARKLFGTGEILERGEAVLTR